MLIFEHSHTGCYAFAQAPKEEADISNLPNDCLRQTEPMLPQASELQVVRHYTRLSRKNFSIDTHFYPLGSCTMKYNPRGVQRAVDHSGFANCHPLLPSETIQGYLQCLYV